MYIWSIAFYVTKIWTVREEDQQYLGRLEVWYWRRTGKISWSECVKNEGLRKGRKTFCIK